MTEAVEGFKHLGLLSILLGWIGYAFLIYKWPGKTSMSFSQHSARNIYSYLFSILIYVITIPMFYLYALKWLTPTFNLPRLFTNLIIIQFIMQIIYVLVPDRKGLHGLIHKVTAYTFAVILIPLTTIIFQSSEVSFIGRSITFLSSLYMIFGIILLVWKKGKLPNYLYLQAAYVISFHISILAATYF